MKSRKLGAPNWSRESARCLFWTIAHGAVKQWSVLQAPPGIASSTATCPPGRQLVPNEILQWTSARKTWFALGTTMISIQRIAFGFKLSFCLSIPAASVPLSLTLWSLLTSRCLWYRSPHQTKVVALRTQQMGRFSDKPSISSTKARSDSWCFPFLDDVRPSLPSR